MKPNDNNKEEKKRALAVLSFPKSLFDFLWVYLAYGTEYEWDLLALPTGKKNDNGEWVVEVDKYAEKSGVFKNIIINNESLVDNGFLTKVIKILRFIVFAIIGKQTKLTKKDISKVIDIDKYDTIVTSYLGTIFIGELVTLSGEKEICLLEDGARDYVEHRKFPSINTIKREGIEMELAGFFLSKLGYADVTIEYDFKPLYNCIKYSSRPDELRYRKYREIRKLRDRSIINNEEFTGLIKKAYDLELGNKPFDAILFTASLTNDFDVERKIIGNICKYISEKHTNGRICLKKHHKDKEEYNFADNIRIVNVDSSVPAEVFLETIEAKKYYFMWPSTIILSLPKNVEFNVLYDDSCFNSMYNSEHLEYALNVIHLDNDNLINVSVE